ncbi:MAG: ABC transporter permease [Caldilineales bacterium]|nr:ABC transporter permease [Caldilineales bacterium]
MTDRPNHGGVAARPAAAPRLRRDSIQALWRGVLLPVLSILAALAVGALILALAGYDVRSAYAALWDGVFGNTRNIGEAFLRATPLILIGAGIAVAFRAGIWNIGAEGQFYLGTIGAAWFGLNAASLPPAVAIPLAIAVGFIFGGVWAGIAGWLKVRLGLNEVVTTIMLNYIALGLVSFLITGPMMESIRANPQTDLVARSILLPRIWPPTRVHLGFILAAIAAAVLAFSLFRTPLGFAIRAVGLNPTAARHAGIDVGRQFVLAMLLSGGAAGIAGAVEVMGVTERLYANISPGYGFQGIAVSLLASNNPLGVILSGWLFGALGSGSQMMQLTAGIPDVMIYILQGLVILFLVSFRLLGDKLGRR